MRSAARLAVVLLGGVISMAPAAARQADPVADLLDGLESAIAARDVGALRGHFSPTLPAGDRAVVEDLVAAGLTVSLTERSRTAADVQIDALVSRGDRAVLADWWMTMADDRAGRVTVASLRETSRIDDLVRMEPDVAGPLTVRNLRVDGPDFTLTLPTGTALVARVDGAFAALLLQGRSTVRFAPTDLVEQGQLRIFGGRPMLEDTADDVFIRLNPADAERLIHGDFLPVVNVRTGTVERLRQLFHERATIDHRLELSHLSPSNWSLNARPGSLLVDARTRRHGWLVYTRSPAAEQDVSLFDRERRRQISLYSSAPDRTTATVALDPPYRIEHTDLDVVLDPARQWLRGRATLRLRVTGPTRAVALRLADALRVVSVSSPRLGPLSNLRSGGDGGLVIGWPLPFASADTEEVVIQFQGRLAPQTLDDDAPAARRLLGAEDALGVEPRFLYSNAVPWYPQASGSQFATATLRVTVPDPYDVVATGERGDAIVSPFAEPPGSPSPHDGRTVTFTADQPVRYLALLVARLRDVAERPASGPASPAAVRLLEGGGAGVARLPTVDRIQRIHAFYTDLLGGAPYPELTVVALADDLPSGHSPAYFALINQPVPTTPFVWNRDPVAFDDTPDFFLAHEIAHQWFGQAVTGRDYREQWITEGFAQYLAWMYVTSEQGADAGDRLMRRMRETAEAFADEGPIYLGFRVGHLRGDRRAFRAIVYNKAAVVLHQLRRVIGDASFLAGLRHLAATHRFAAVSTGDVQRAFAQHTSMPLERFFTRWIRENGAPTLRVGWSVTASSLVIDVEQTGAVFDVSHDVTVEFADGGRQRVPLVLTEPQQQFVVPIATPVRRVDTNDPSSLARVPR